MTTTHRRTVALEAQGQKLYRAEVEERRTAVFYILADDKLQAQDDANEIGPEFGNDLGWDQIDTDVFVWPETRAPVDGAEVWVGGEKGDWHSWRDIVS